ncbi:MAG: hypothetical protein IRZ04_05055 [Rhodospirillales bacterium]|nr:hypothetical protein [Rhodospirillales bacterium]
MRSFLAALTLSALALPAGATTVCYVPYSQFEEEVRHLDLAVCPDKDLRNDEGFCRLGLEGTTAYIYEFRFKGDDACLERIDSLPWAEFAKRFGTSYESKD